MSDNTTMTCPVCNSEIDTASEKCPDCGIELDMFHTEDSASNNDVMASDEVALSPDVSESVVFQCPECDAEVNEDASECPSCSISFQEDEKAVFDEKLKDARQKLSELRDTGADISIVKELMKEAVSAGKAQDYHIATEKAEQCIESAITEMEIQSMLESKGTEGDLIEGDLIEDDLIEGDLIEDDLVEDGLIEDDLVEDGLIEDDLVEDGLIEGDLVEDDLVEDGLIEENLVEDDLVEDGLIEEDLVEENLVEENWVEDRALANEFASKMDQARVKLSEIRESTVDIAPIKQLMKKARMAEDEGDLRKGLKHLEELISNSEQVHLITDLFEKGKERIRDLKSKGLQFDPTLKELKKAKKDADAGYIDDAVNKIKIALENSEKAMKKAEKKASEELKSRCDDKLKTVNDLISKVKETDIVYSNVSKLITIAGKEMRSGDMENALEKLDTAVEHSNQIIDIRGLIDDGKLKIKELKNFDLAEKSYLEALKNGKSLADKGRYNESMEIIRKTLYEMDDKIKSAPKKQEPEKKKKASVSDIESMVAELKGLLTTAKKHGINVKGGKDIISKAFASIAEKNLDNTLSLLQEGKEKINDFLRDVIQDELVSLELYVDEMPEDEVEELIDLIQGAKVALERQDYEESLTLVNKANSIKSSPDEPLDVAESNVAFAGKVVYDADILGIDISKANELLHKAKLDIEIGDWESAENYAQDAKKDIFKKVPNALSSITREAQMELKKAKIFGVDVSKQIDILKRAKYAKDDGDMEKCLSLLKSYRENMESLGR